MWSGNSDNTCLHVRTGPLSLYHESRNGWSPTRIADRIYELQVEWSAWYNARATADGFGRPPLLPIDVTVTIELDGPGFSVLDLCHGRGQWGGVKVAESCDELDSMGKIKYFNQRAAMWFQGRDKALSGQMDLSRLPKEVLFRLENQLLTPAYDDYTGGKLKVEEKKKLKERLRRSPDDADALLLAYFDAPSYSPTVLFSNKGDRR